MNEIEDKIGFIPVRERIMELCTTSGGRKRAEKMVMMTDFKRVKEHLLQTNDLLRAITSGIDIPEVPDIDMNPILTLSSTPGSHISAEGFFDLLKVIRSLAELRSFIERNKTEYSALHMALNSLVSYPELENEIERVIDKYGQVKPTASEKLYELSRKVESESSRIGDVMRRVLARAVSEGWVDKDTTPAMRDGRLVIPISAADRRQINGIVHDVSASGRTSYVEPAEIVEAGNRLRALEREKEHEIVVILTQLTDMVREYSDELADGVRLLSIYDFIKAKSRYAFECGAQMPVLEHKPGFEWYGAEHPALKIALEKQGRKVVPLTVTLTPEKRALIISGPNAGGKSVCLKTLGCVQYMIQCGILPTLHDNSHVCVLRQILIDIGDQQSIENDLSTYSSHLRNMKSFMIKADSRTLVLIDEIGSGTEPTIGGALAQSILEKLGESRCFCVATTHYQNLKTFAEETAGFVNGSMLYDRSRFQPLYQLEVGHPGSSFALEIARSIGLPNDVLNKAKELVGEDYVNMDKYLLDIARDRRYWANRRREVKEKETKVNRLMEQYEQQMSELKSKGREMIHEARQHAAEILQTTNAKIERTIREIRESQAEREKTKAVRAELEDYKRTINESEAERDEKLTNSSVRKKPSSKRDMTKIGQDSAIKVGGYVRMSDGGITGQVLSIEGKNAEVAFGAIRTRVSVNKLRAVNAPRQSATTQSETLTRSTTDDIRARQLRFNPEIDVRGMRADEALQAVTYFLDDASQFSAQRVRILHGTGTGALRQAIRQYLSTSPVVEHYADEDVRFGGAGITVVTMS